MVAGFLLFVLVALLLPLSCLGAVLMWWLETEGWIRYDNKSRANERGARSW